MCGIVGGLSFTGVYFPDKTELSLASGFLDFRGPDDSGDLFLEIGCTKLSMAHRRLSIIDLSSSGRQPMTSNSGRSYIVFNGEIYNYQDLRSELIACGYSFKSNSDTEVILNGYECWGFEEMLCRLDGMFALALFDKSQETLYLARDRFGKKPLYYHVHKKGLVFSSDIRSFKKISGIDLTLDLYALGYFFAELATPHEATIWKEVKKLIPGNFLTLTKDGVVANSHYWLLNYTDVCALKQPEFVEKTEYLLG
jgi:asparagine synthase (glutamine-hydrolysing)